MSAAPPIVGESGESGESGERLVSGDRIVVGIGARRGVGIRDLRMAIGECLAASGVRARDIVAIVTVDAKRSEPALNELADFLGVPLRALPADLLARQSVPNPSSAVDAAVGTPSVAEAAVLASGAELIVPKHRSRGVTAAAGRLPASGTVSIGAVDEPVGVLDLAHHGDAETAPGLIDLAVNVRSTPVWLRERLRETVDELAAYPNASRATAAVAARHGRPPDQVLLTAGAAEAFVLLARALSPHRAVVVHPQFTEPEVALNAAGHSVRRVVLEPPFGLDPALVPAEADLVFVGNPTNPTSVLHPARTLLELVRPGRVLVVDEAFMDAVPGEPETLAGSASRPPPQVPGLVVIRSLTKTWGLAGLRIGYLLGDPELLRACRAVQPLWSVGSLALAAAIACSGPGALAEAADLAVAGVGEREHLLGALSRLGDLAVAAPPQAPFVLLRVFGPDPAGVHQRLRADGWAVRRADTFPGLAPGWLRVAIRDRDTSEAFASALDRAVHPDQSAGTESASTHPGTIDLRDAAQQFSQHRQESS
jgi:histidinol-phosphate aminotransferase